jgi:isopenicillin N synthase-like dioxygenase
VFQEPSGAPGLQVYLPRSAIDTSPTSQAPLPVPGTSRVEAHDTDDIDHTDHTWAWYDAPVPPPGGFLVNVGLAMELWSSGAYKATLHRVIFPNDGALGDRDTLAFFVQPDDDVVGNCGCGCPFRTGPPKSVSAMLGGASRAW